VELLKGNSSKWIHDERGFEWQKGYAAFRIGISGVAETIAYIENQAEPHRRVTFEEELAAILRKHGLEFQPGRLD